MLTFTDDGDPIDPNLEALYREADQMTSILFYIDRLVQKASYKCRAAREACFAVEALCAPCMDRIDELLQAREAGAQVYPMDIEKFRETAACIRKGIDRAKGRAQEPGIEHYDVWAKALEYLNEHVNTLDDMYYEATNAATYYQDGVLHERWPLELAVEPATITPLIGQAQDEQAAQAA